MSANEILSRAARLLIHNRLFWPLGFLTAIGGLCYGLVPRLLGLKLAGSDVMAPAAILAPAFEDWVRRPSGPILAGVILLLGGLVFWLIAAAAEGGIIRATALMELGQDVSFSQAWAGGRSVLMRFVAIDTILFLPLFAVMLAAMLLSSAGFFGTILVNLQRSPTLEDMLKGLGLTAAITLPLICFLLPVGLLTYFMRLFAFREAALAQTATGESIRNGWHFLRDHASAAAGLAILLYAIRYLVRMLLSTVTVPLAVPGVMVFVGPWLGFENRANGLVILATAAGLLAVFINAVGSAILSAYGSVCWTLAYRSWKAKRVIVRD
jgi:hypothetical protein